MNLITKLVVTVLILIAFKINAAEFKNKDNPTVQEVVEKTTESETSRHSDSQTAEDLAMEFLDEVGLTEGENGDLFVAVGSAVLPEEDPATNPDFLMMREMKAKGRVCNDSFIWPSGGSATSGLGRMEAAAMVFGVFWSSSNQKGRTLKISCSNFMCIWRNAML